jgi:hypothetical protein
MVFRTMPGRELLGMAPAEHYFWVGARLCRKPSAASDHSVYPAAETAREEESEYSASDFLCRDDSRIDGK